MSGLEQQKQEREERIRGVAERDFKRLMHLRHPATQEALHRALDVFLTFAVKDYEYSDHAERLRGLLLGDS